MAFQTFIWGIEFRSSYLPSKYVTDHIISWELLLSVLKHKWIMLVPVPSYCMVGNTSSHFLPFHLPSLPVSFSRSVYCLTGLLKSPSAAFSWTLLYTFSYVWPLLSFRAHSPQNTFFLTSLITGACLCCADIASLTTSSKFYTTLYLQGPITVLGTVCTLEKEVVWRGKLRSLLRKQFSFQREHRN